MSTPNWAKAVTVSVSMICGTTIILFALSLGHDGLLVTTALTFLGIGGGFAAGKMPLKDMLRGDADA